MIEQVLDEADRRDPKHQRTWVALVDGNNHQIQRLKAGAKTRKVKITIVVDFVHVLEYLWNATWCFHAARDPAAEKWVHRQATAVLNGHARTVAGIIRRKATNAHLDPANRKIAEEAATYLTRKAAYLDYPTALEHGWPIDHPPRRMLTADVAGRKSTRSPQTKPPTDLDRRVLSPSAVFDERSATVSTPKTSRIFPPQRPSPHQPKPRK